MAYACGCIVRVYDILFTLSDGVTYTCRILMGESVGKLSMFPRCASSRFLSIPSPPSGLVWVLSKGLPLTGLASEPRD
jgi:hypothetical protein